jgi:hypothetical protein
MSEIHRVLTASRPSFHHSPLEDIVKLLCDGRHYTWVGVYLQVAEKGSQQLLEAGADSHPGQMQLPETRKKILVSIRVAGHQLGFLDVESDQENSLGAEDRVLLEEVANLLARFLSGPGKYLVRKARSAQSTFESRRSAAVGED